MRFYFLFKAQRHYNMQRKFQFWISTENSRFWAPDPKRRIKKKSFGSKFWSVWKPLEAILEPRYLRVLKNCTSTDWNRKQFAVRKCQRYCTFILYTILCNCVYIVLDIFLLKCLHHFQNKVVKMSYFQFVSCHLLSETEYFVPCNKKLVKSPQAIYFDCLFPYRVSGLLETTQLLRDEGAVHPG